MNRSLAVLAAVAAIVSGGSARADGTCTPDHAAPAAATWGSPAVVTTGPAEERSPIARARDMLTRARILDEAATHDEQRAAELSRKLPSLRMQAKVARDRAERAAPQEKTELVARAEDLEADVVVSEAEITARQRSAVESRSTARDLRARAVRIAKEPPEVVVDSCDPPFRYTSDGRKTYRLECLR